MTTTTAKAEIVGGDVHIGDIIQLTDYFGGTRGSLVVFVLDVEPAGGSAIFLEGMACAIDGAPVFGVVIVTVDALEPIGRCGTMDPSDWSADYARRAAMA